MGSIVAQPPPTRPSRPRRTDAQLVQRLCAVYRELRGIEADLKRQVEGRGATPQRISAYASVADARQVVRCAAKALFFRDPFAVCHCETCEAAS